MATRKMLSAIPVLANRTTCGMPLKNSKHGFWKAVQARSVMRKLCCNPAFALNVGAKPFCVIPPVSSRLLARHFQL
ncbi:hypothetical protein D9M73_286850 [compost metagenome]